MVLVNPFPLVNDGDLLEKICHLVRWRGPGNTAVSKVKGHADEGLVALGRVRDIDRVGNNEADAAASLGRRRVHHCISSARDVVARSCARWYPVVCDLHRFFIAIARSVVNDDGGSGTSLDPVVWSRNYTLKKRRVRVCDDNFARLPGSAALWASHWYCLPIARIGDDDISSWPFSVGLLVKIVHFLGSLHWPQGVGDLGVGGVSYLELLILYEQWAGERLVVESVLWFVGVMFPMFFMVLGGRGFVLMESFLVLGLMMIKGDVFHLMSGFLFLGKGWVDVLGCCTIPCLQVSV